MAKRKQVKKDPFENYIDVKKLTPSQRKWIGRKVLNATIANAPDGTRINKDGDLMLADGSVVQRLGKGRGKNSQYGYQSAKDITDEKATFDKIYEQIAIDEARPEFAQELADEEQRQEEQRYGNSRSKYDRPVEAVEYDRPVEAGSAIGEQVLPKQETVRDVVNKKFTDLPLKEQIRSILPSPIKYAVNSAEDTLTSANKLRDQVNNEGVGSTLQDIGTGTMAELAAPFSASSSQWWKDKLNNRNGEAGSVGEKIADEAMLGAVGGVAGKGIGTVYKGMKQGSEAFRDRVSKLAQRSANQVKSNNIRANLKLKNEQKLGIDLQSPETQILDPQMVKQQTYENLTEVPERASYVRSLLGIGKAVEGNPVNPNWDKMTKIKKRFNDIVLEPKERMPLIPGTESVKGVGFNPVEPSRIANPWGARFGDAVKHNTERKFGKRGMLKSNDDELAALYERVGDLDKAKQLQLNQWDMLPTVGRNAGIGAGVVAGWE